MRKVDMTRNLGLLILIGFLISMILCLLAGALFVAALVTDGIDSTMMARFESEPVEGWDHWLSHYRGEAIRSAALPALGLLAILGLLVWGVVRSWRALNFDPQS